MLPRPGSMPEFDLAEKTIGEIEKTLDKALHKAQAQLGTNKLSYYHPGVSKEK